MDVRKISNNFYIHNTNFIRSLKSKLRPDTFIYTTADQNGFLIPQAGAYFVVNNAGEIFWPSPQTQLRVRCRMLKKLLFILICQKNFNY